MRETPYPLRSAVSPDVRQIAQALGVPELVAQVLANRGVTSRDALARLLSPSQLAEPAALPDLDQAVAVIDEAVRGGGHIRVYGDYDADGVTATAVLVRALRYLGGPDARVDYHIPNRFDEGYGLSPEGVQGAYRDGVDLLVTVDCGASSQEAAALAKTLGLALVVTDHHALSWPLPQARAVVNPERMAVPNRFSGAGVALQIARALARRHGRNLPEALAAIAAVGTVADVVPLTGDNRALVVAGLDVLRRGLAPGLSALAAAAGRDLGHVAADDLAFYLGPRLNAAGRMGDPRPAVELLLTDDAAIAGGLAAALETANRERRETEASILDAAWNEVWTLAETLGRLPRFVVVGGDGWHHGVIGIVAARLAGALGRPVAVIGWDGERGRGSARSGGATHLVQHLRRQDDLFLRLGGHAGAAGFSLVRTSLAEMSRRLSDGLDEPEDDGMVDGVIAAEDLTDEVLRWLTRLEPYGHGFPRPRLAVRGTLQNVARVGRSGEHVRFRFRDNGLRGIWFRAEGGELRDDAAVWTVGTIQIGHWQGAAEVEWHAETMQAPPPGADWAGRVTVGTVPETVAGPVVVIAESQRELRKFGAQGFVTYDWTRSAGERRAVIEAFNRGRLSRLAFAGWRPWPALRALAEAVVFTVAPLPRESLAWAAHFLAPEGRIWLPVPASAKATEEAIAAKWERLVPTRTDLARLWQALKMGPAPLRPGRLVFAELGLDPHAPPRMKRDLQDSPSYRQGWAWRSAAVTEALESEAPWRQGRRDG